MTRHLSRRDFTALLLGAPFASSVASGGCGAPQVTLPGGSLIDTGMVTGHQRIRDAVSAQSSWRGQSATRHHSVIIIGAGAAGLGAAWALRKAGIADVVVLEHTDHLGGTARGDATADLPHPWGAHYIVAPMKEQTELIELLDDMNAVEAIAADGSVIIDEALRCREPEERIFYRGRWYDGLYPGAGASADDRKQLAAFSAKIGLYASARDNAGRRQFSLPMAQGGNAVEMQALDKMSFATWLDQHGWTSSRLRWLTDYACRDDFGLLARDTSAWAGVFYFAARQQRTGAAAQPVVTWPNGNDAIIAHLAKGIAVERNCSVIEVEASTQRATLTVASGNEVVRMTANHVICAVPQFIAKRIVVGLGARQTNDQPVYGSWAVANVHLRHRPHKRSGDAPSAWDNVLYSSQSLGYVVATHQAGREYGATVWTWYYPFTDSDVAARRKEIAGAGHAEWAEAVLADLSRAHPDIRQLVTRIDIAFWGHGMVQPRVGSVWTSERLARAAPYQCVHFANTDLSSMALFEEAYSHGRRAAREVIAAVRASASRTDIIDPSGK
jgi:glycine/D-amino acid oxidase-like deaminating enzyme